MAEFGTIEPVPSSTKILFLGAGPDARTLQAVAQEFSEIEDELSHYEDRFHVTPNFESRASKLPRLLMRIKPDVVHFSGHGTDTGELVFLDEQGQARPADPLTIARTFQILQGTVRCVVLNACYSDRQAEEIAKYVPAVIGMCDRIEQRQALAFSKGFYEALGFGRSVEEAFELAKLQAELADVPLADAPKLIKRQSRAIGSVRHSRFAHELNRTLYWRTLRMTCDNDMNHRSFIVHGVARQNLEFFLTRVLRYFKRPEGLRHRIVAVSSDLDHRRAVTAQDWGLHMRTALAATDWPLPEALDDAAHGEAVMFVFCHGSRPLRTRRAGDTIGLDEVELAGFCDFLCSYFPRQLAQARPKHPLRLVVPIEYPDYDGVESDDPLLRAVDAALRAAEGIGYERIPEITQPSWSEVWESIKSIYDQVERRTPPASIGEACRRAYERACGKTFAELADSLAVEFDFDASANT